MRFKAEARLVPPGRRHHWAQAPAPSSDGPPLGPDEALRLQEDGISKGEGRRSDPEGLHVALALDLPIARKQIQSSRPVFGWHMFSLIGT